MRILLGVSGSISAYKSIDVARELFKAGHEVKVILTNGALKFVIPEVFTYLGVESVYNSSENNYIFNATTIIRDYLTKKDFNIVIGVLNPHSRFGFSNLIGGNNNTPIQLVVYYTEF